MEFILGIFTGYFLTWPAFIILLILGTVFEANEEHGLAMFAGILSAVVAYFFFDISLASIVAYIIAYFAIGFVWSIWRYKRYAMEVVLKHKDDNSKVSREYALERLKPTNMLGSLTTWVLIWPFSMVENVSGDLIKLVQSAITKVFKGIYNSIYNNAVAQLTSATKE